jgi:hypothetical protein
MEAARSISDTRLLPCVLFGYDRNACSSVSSKATVLFITSKDTFRTVTPLKHRYSTRSLLLLLEVLWRAYLDRSDWQHEQ